MTTQTGPPATIFSINRTNTIQNKLIETQPVRA